MKLSDYAKSKGISYQTAWRMWKRGELKATQLPSGTIIVDVSKPIEGAVIYARVSSSENKSNLESQAERLKRYTLMHTLHESKDKIDKFAIATQNL
jgi:predicted site-specific integrase-resolvase